MSMSWCTTRTRVIWTPSRIGRASRVGASGCPYSLRPAVGLEVPDGPNRAGGPARSRRAETDLHAAAAKLPALAGCEPSDTCHRLVDLVLGRGVAHADVPFAGWPERPAGDHRDVLLAQQALRERLRRQPRGRDLRERIERATWLERAQPDRVHPAEKVWARAIVGGDHPLHVRLPGTQRLQGRVLGRGWGGHDPVLVDLDDPLHHAGRAAQETPPPAGHRVGLGEAADQ